MNVVWLVALGAYRWSTQAITHSGTNYTASIIPDTFSGVTMRWDARGKGLIAPSEVSFDVANVSGSISRSDVEQKYLSVALVVNGSTKRTWKFFCKKATPFYGKIRLNCEDILQRHLRGHFPNTPHPKEIFPGSDVDPDHGDNFCVPIVLGQAYIPVMSVPHNDSRWYVLSKGGTPSITEVTSPDRWAVSGKWDNTYSYPTTTAGGYSLAQLIIQDSDGDGVADANGLWGMGSGYLPPLVKYTVSTTSSITNPAQWVSFLLQAYGVNVDDIDLDGTFATASASYASRGITFNGGFWETQPRETVLSNLLAQCDSRLVVADKIKLIPFSKASKETVTSAKVQKLSYSPSVATQSTSDGGRVAWAPSGSPQHTLTGRAIVSLYPGQTDVNDPDGEVLECRFISSSTVAQSMGSLYFQKKLGLQDNVSFKTSATVLASYDTIYPGDVLTLSDSVFGGTQTIIATEIGFEKDLSITIRGSRMGELHEWSDFSPTAIAIPDNFDPGFALIGDVIDDIMSQLKGNIDEEWFTNPFNSRIDIIDTDMIFDEIYDDVYAGLDGGYKLIYESQTQVVDQLQVTNNSLVAVVAAVEAQDATLTAHNTWIVDLQTAVNNPETGLVAASQAVDLLDTRLVVAEGEISTQAASITALQSDIDDPATGLAANAAAVDAMVTDVSLLDGEITAVAGRTTTLEATVGDGMSGLVHQVSAVEATLDEVTAEHALVVNAAGNIAGYRVIASSDAPSEFTILADKFQVILPDGSGSPKQPFTVGTVNEIGSVVGIDGTLVVDGSILAKKISTDDLSAISADLGVVTAGVMQSSNYGELAGTQIDLENETVRFGGFGAPGLEWNGAAKELVIRGAIIQSPSNDSFPLPVHRGEYSASETYYRGDTVRYEGQVWLYVNTASSSGTTPQTGAYWFLYVSRGEDGTGLNILGSVATSNDLPVSGNTGDAWIADDTGNLWVWDASGNTWIDVGEVRGPKGDPGTPGKSVFEALIFRRSSSTPGTPTGGSFNFGTQTLSPPSGWSASIPSGTTPVWVSTAVFSVVGDTGTASSPTWSTPVKAFEDGTHGEHGQAVDMIFRRNATQPATPGNSSGTPSGWYTNVNSVPSGTNPIWSSVGTRATPTSLWVWQTPLKVEGQDGAPGAPGSPGDPGSPGAPGNDGWSVWLTNGNHTYPADNSGNVVGGFAGGYCQVRVMNGATSFVCTSTHTSTTSTEGQYRVTARSNPAGMNTTVGLVGGNYELRPTSFTSDAAVVSLTIQARLDGQNYYFYLDASYSKAKQGAVGNTGPTGPDGATGPQGDLGPGLVFRGDFVNSVYYNTTTRRDVVKLGSDFYAYIREGINSESSFISSRWEKFDNFKMVATDLLLAQDAAVTKSINIGTGGVNTAGISGEGSGDTAVRMWAGGTRAVTSNFRVQQDGTVRCAKELRITDSGVLRLEGVSTRILLDAGQIHSSVGSGATTLYFSGGNGSRVIAQSWNEDLQLGRANGTINSQSSASGIDLGDGTISITHMPNINGTKIIDSGNSGNKYFIKYSDGTLICWETNFVMTRHDSSHCRGAWYWPSPYISTPTVTVTLRTKTAAPTYDEIGIIRAGMYSTYALLYGYRIAGMTDFAVGNTMNVHIQTVGRWK